jgi:predicted GIY-YIG superfamily endonuclease
MNIKVSIYKFLGPFKLATWDPPQQPGIYAIYVYRPTFPSCEPYEGPIYIGVTDDFSKRGFPKSHDKIDYWDQIAGKDDLFIAYFPCNSKSKRILIEKSLINKIKPVCNEKI